ncbi:MAG: hypothetical protein E7525_04715 [Ruminococcaceae bacterium]|nr:hypothetical protein [Oscillospiraceae bacterium]
MEVINNELVPFNDIWYLDCFRHGLAQIAYTNGFLMELFENDYFEYVFNFEDGRPNLKMETRSFVRWEEIFLKNGVAVQWTDSCENCLPELQAHLRAGSHVLLPVDCFYENIRPDTFNKEHVLHYMLLCGFDDNTEEFLILEHNYENDLRYKHKRIEFDSAIQAHNASKHLHPSGLCKCVVFKGGTQNKLINADNTVNVFNGVKAFLRSLNDLKKFVEYFCEIEITPDNERAYLDFYKSMFEKVYAAKKYQSYFYDYILQSRETQLLKEFTSLGSFNDWAIIIGMFLRCLIRNEISIGFVDKINKILHRVIEKENEWKKVFCDAGDIENNKGRFEKAF